MPVESSWFFPPMAKQHRCDGNDIPLSRAWCGIPHYSAHPYARRQGTNFPAKLLLYSPRAELTYDVTFESWVEAARRCVYVVNCLATSEYMRKGLLLQRNAQTFEKNIF